MKTLVIIFSFMLLTTNLFCYGAQERLLDPQKLIDEILKLAVEKGDIEYIKLIAKNKQGSREVISQMLEKALKKYQEDKRNMGELEFIEAKSPTILALLLADSFMQFDKVPDSIRRAFNNMQLTGDKAEFPDKFFEIEKMYGKNAEQKKEAAKEIEPAG